MKIGILTYHRSHNYGAFLQAYSLSNALNKIDGVDCELIDYNLCKEENVYKTRIWKRPIYFLQYYRQDKMFKEQRKEQLLSKDEILSDDYKAVLDYANNKYDIVVVGSDEIWRIASRGFPNAYWLPGKYSFKKMSYAASGRNSNTVFTEDVKNKMREFYGDFCYIGVRDEITKRQVEELGIDININRNCDPSFLYPKYNKNKIELRNKICEKYKINANKKIIAIAYDRVDVITKLRKLLGKNYEFICITRPMWNANKNLCSITPFEWVDIIGGSDYLITSYFHGMLFAVNQNTPFIAIDRRANRDNLKSSKLYDFLEYSNMQDRYNIASELNEEEFQKISIKIKEEIKKTIDFGDIVNSQIALFENFYRVIEEIKNERKG